MAIHHLELNLESNAKPKISMQVDLKVSKQVDLVKKLKEENRRTSSLSSAAVGDAAFSPSAPGVFLPLLGVDGVLGLRTRVLLACGNKSSLRNKTLPSHQVGNFKYEAIHIEQVLNIQ